MATRAKNQVINLPFVKGEPIRFSGELANAPSYGSGCVKVREELLVPLTNPGDYVVRTGAASTGKYNDGIRFWPFLRKDGTIKWYYEYEEGDPVANERWNEIR